MQAQTFVFLGPQGSGKGTQANKLTNFLQNNSEREVFHFETGKAFRKLSETDTKTGERVSESMNAGDIQPVFLATKLWADEFIKKLTPEKHLIVDGSPRTVLEAKTLDEAFSFYKRLPVTVIHLTLPESVTYERLSDRGRDDDHHKAIAHRLDQYQERTLPVAEMYKTSDAYDYVRIDGEQTINKIQREIQNTIND